MIFLKTKQTASHDVLRRYNVAKMAYLITNGTVGRTVYDVQK